MAAWAAAGRTGVWSPETMPAPEEVLRALRVNLANGQIIDALGVSLARMSVGFVISFGVGTVLGLLTAASTVLGESLGGLILGLQSLPSITWLPLAVVWFGANEYAIIFVVLMGSTFSIAYSAQSGARGLPPLMSRVAGTLGASRWQSFWFVMVPAMVPSMVRGMKQGWSFAWRALMAGELLVTAGGLGRMLDAGRRANDLSLVFAMMIVIVVVGVAVDRLLFGRAEAWVRERWGFAAA
jgi:NitT/TauT family transport system permease protein